MTFIPYFLCTFFTKPESQASLDLERVCTQNNVYSYHGSVPAQDLHHLSRTVPILRHIKQRLQLLDEQPLLIADVGTVELLERVDALPRDHRVERILLVQVAAVERLVGALDLDRDGGGALFGVGDGFVFAFDGGAGGGEC